MNEQPGQPDCAACETQSAWRHYVEVAAALLVVLAGVLAIRNLDVLPSGLSLSDNIGYGAAFLIGLMASVSTCIAVTGGLWVGFAARLEEAGGTGLKKFYPHLLFNLGRLVSYALLGGLIGAIGSALTLSPAMSAGITIAASLIMILFGLRMLKLFPSFGGFRALVPLRFLKWMNERMAGNTNIAALSFGAVTFFLPCGFTQALQLYVLARGDFVVGALTMFIFALGTMPALLALSAGTSLSTGRLRGYFLKAAGAAIVLLGIVNIQSSLVTGGQDQNLSAISVPAATDPANQSRLGGVVLSDGKQIASMKIVGLDYVPNRFSVDAGKPVEWHIDAKEAEGCGRVLVIPKLRLSRLLSREQSNVIAFTPWEAGEIEFNCGMRMMTPGSKFIVSATPS
jgi:sulfite exporter TauE/SafE